MTGEVLLFYNILPVSPFARARVLLIESPLFHIMPTNAIVEQRFQLAILFRQIVKKDKEKYSAFSAAFLSLQFAELLGYPAHYIRSDEDIREAVGLWCNNRKAAEEKYGPIRDWNTRQVTDMSELFSNKTNFNDDIGCWDTSTCTSMEHMFCGARVFNQPLAFDTSSCATMESMFYNAAVFNQPLAFDTSSCTTMECMFFRATAFNQPLAFDTSSCTTMAGMFQGAAEFNQSLDWDLSNCNVEGMFEGATAFNQL